MKIAENGDTMWTMSYGGLGDDRSRAGQQTQDGGYIIVGYTNSFGAGDYDVFLSKTDSLGNNLWTRTFGGSYPDCGYAVQQTQDGGYIVAGYTTSFGAGSHDAYLIKTDAEGNVTGVEADNDNKPEVKRALEVYPNPFHDQTKIAYCVGRSASDAKLKIYDVTGRSVKDFSHSTSNFSLPTSAFWDGTDDCGQKLPNGIYFVKLDANDFGVTRKMVVLR